KFLDYSTTPDQDISSRFVLDVVSEKSIRLRLKDGQSLENNAAYQITVNGITDVAGNIATGSSLAAGGKYTYSLTAPDTLAPRTLNIVRVPDGTAVNPAMTLTRGRIYNFAVREADNYPGKVTFKSRVLVDSNQVAWTNVNADTNRFEYSAFQNHQFFNVELEAVDAAGKTIVPSFNAGLVDPMINLESFRTNPDEPEESVRSEAHFDLIGDVDMVTAAVITVEQMKSGRMDATSKYNDDTGEVYASYINPKLQDIPGVAAGALSAQMNVNL